MSQLVVPISRLNVRFPFLPGLGLSLAVTIAGEAAEKLELLVFGHAWVEALALAIVFGAIYRHFARPGAVYRPGIAWSGKYLLEVAVVLLGASISAEAVAGAGPIFVLAVAGVVVVSIAASFTIGRLLGLRWRLALLLACGNSICGNSAIAAVAPVIGADSDEIASTIAFTAVLGVAAVLLMPFLCGVLGFDFRQYGIFAGLTVYAVPQVIAATAPISTLSVGVGTLTKLIRVLMLGPTIFGIALLTRRTHAAKPGLGHLLPWFIVGFLGAMALRSFDLIPDALQAPIALLASALTVVSMAALGLSVDLRAVAASGGRVIAGATLSLLVLACLAYGVIRLF
ncbi:MAG TPA: putative sulfate exporter family transporter [Devosia sp.]|nr:putative sulfate exporter family transporter [Devosia sp.]